MKHYIVMNGSVGCLPDNTEVHDTKESAIESVLALFDDYPVDFRAELEESGIYYFEHIAAGADYVEIIEEECIGEGSGCEYHDSE